MSAYNFFDRDISWLTFNGLILEQAERTTLPLLERLNFLAIFSSNLDEFYRVRMPVLAALNHLGKNDKASIDDDNDLLNRAKLKITEQQQKFGQIFNHDIIQSLSANNITLFFNQQWNTQIATQVSDFFFSQVMAFLRPIEITSNKKSFFPQNNQLYFLINLVDVNKRERTVVLNIPSGSLSRFLRIDSAEKTFIVFLDDIIRYNLDKIFKHETVTGCYSFKITRDAELDLHDEYPGDLSEQVEKLLLKRDLGIATRFLHQPGLPLRTMHLISDIWNIQQNSIVEGGTYHNLKDLFSFPVNVPQLRYDKWPSIIFTPKKPAECIFERIKKKDQLINTPYQSYGTILRFFNEAALDEFVEEIYITLYRVASDSRIVNALINATSAGKKVTVLVELKARFDEANNVKWAKRMKAAGVTIIYSVIALKVHAKVALVLRREDSRVKYYGLLSTGNFNETTASFYTDHILMTANGAMLREIELLFIFLARREKPKSPDLVKFNHLLVAQFNLLPRFLEMIDREISAQKGLPSGIKIKLNNLEERTLISKLYEASQAGVKVLMIVRSICCLIPGVKGMSENITVKRIVDRYLEHGRAFIFNNNGNPQVYLGSADWMNRNIYRRIEVCFPIYDEQLKAEIIDIVNLELQDNVQAVLLNQQLENEPIDVAVPAVRSQQKIFELLQIISSGQPNKQ